MALYRVSSACLVTSLRDGMNLVAYEFIACQATSACFECMLRAHATDVRVCGTRRRGQRRACSSCPSSLGRLRRLAPDV